MGDIFSPRCKSRKGLQILGGRAKCKAMLLDVISAILTAFQSQVAMKALGFDVKKAEVLKLLKEYDRDDSGNMYWDDFFDIS